MSSGLNFCHRTASERDESGGVETFGQIHNIDEMMRHTGAFFSMKLGGSDVESAIDLHGIHRDDFAIKLFRENHGDAGFPGGGGPGQKNWRPLVDGDGYAHSGGIV